MKAFSNKKKIRGWKRQIAKVEKWFNQNKNPSTNSIEEWRDEYVKIGIDPWNRLVKRNPPIWFFHLIIDKLAEMYDLWNIEFKKGPSPFDLQLWIYEKGYINSELVSSRTREIGETRNNYFIECKVERRFPVNTFKTKRFNPNDFDWKLGYASEMLFEKSDNLDGKEIERLKRMGYNQDYKQIGTEDGQMMFWKPYDYVWIGRKKQI